MATVRPIDAVDPAGRLFTLMLGVFFGGGLLASVEALLVPRLKILLHIGFADALLVQLVYYAGYLIFAWPAAAAMARIGAMRATASGLAIAAAGCALLGIAQAKLAFPPMLAALLLLSAGVTMLQVACNAVMATHGGGSRTASRFTLLQGFNALGTVAGPLIGARVLLGDIVGVTPTTIFVAFAMGFGVLAMAFAFHHDLLPAAIKHAAPSAARLGEVIRRPRMARGMAAIFVYVGAEVTIGTLAVSYLMLPGSAHIGAVMAGQLVSLYWGGAMVGRFAGAWVLRWVGAARLLGGAAIAATALLGVAIGVDGMVGSAALLSVGFCNSIMFPTIYTLAMPDRSDDVPVASMLLCMSVVGGSVIPILTGLIADAAKLSLALALPATCYVGIALFARGVRAARS